MKHERTTFQEQSEQWLMNLSARRKNPIKPSSLAQFRSHLRRLNDRIGGMPLEEVTNRTMKDLATVLPGSPKTIQCYLTTAKAIVASAVDSEGNQLYPRTWNHDFIDAPTITEQKTPTFTSEQVSDIVKHGGDFSLLFKLAAGTGLRIGELLALQYKHRFGRTLKVEQSLWSGRIQPPKTASSKREVDIPKELGVQIIEKSLLEDPNEFVFGLQYPQALRGLHTVLDKLKIEKTGYHAFRRFRATHLGKERVPNELIKFWLGHSDGDVTARYDKIEKNLEFRLSEAERVGLGWRDTAASDATITTSKFGKRKAGFRVVVANPECV